METPPTLQPTPEISAGSRASRAVAVFILTLVFALSGLTAYGYLDTADIVAGAQPATVARAVPPAPSAFASLQLAAQGAIVLDATSGQTLFAQNADVQLPLASITKVALVLAISEVLPSSSLMTVTDALPATGTTGAIPAGSRWHVQDIVDLTLVGSSNGGAELLSRAADEPLRVRYREALGGSAAVWLMNRIAREHGGTDMYFLNPSGLDESATQSSGYGSARSVAALFSYAASASPDLFAATARKEVSITSQEGRAVVARNTDDALDAIPGIVMGKTGYTELAGGNLAVVFEISGHRIVAVVLGSTKDGRFSDMRAIASAAQEAFSPNR